MDDKGVIGLTWKLVQSQQKLLEILVLTVHDMGGCLIGGRNPSQKEVDTWSEVNAQVSQDLPDINVLYESVRQAVDPLLHFDA
jgi:hypothetical protein